MWRELECKHKLLKYAMIMFIRPGNDFLLYGMIYV